jgi:AraC family transcriptional regulator, positive regulator of tynA and feaB
MSTPPERFWSTNAVRPAQRFAFWHDAVSNAVLNVDVETPDRDQFEGWIVARTRGQACFSTFSSAPHRILRTKRHLARNHDDNYLVSFQIEGNANIEQRGQRLLLAPGDIGIVNGGLPFHVEFPNKVRRVVAVLPRGLLPMQRADLAIRLPKLASNHPLSSLVRAYMVRLANTRDQLSPTQTQVLLNNVCALLSVAPPEQNRSVTAETITAWLRSHLGERDISPAKAAAAFGVSLRTVHGAMARAGISFGALLLQERLTACSETLRAYPARSVSEIAFIYGFASTAHFHRTFKSRFGMTPREWQELARSDNSQLPPLHAQSQFLP